MVKVVEVVEGFKNTLLQIFTSIASSDNRDMVTQDSCKIHIWILHTVYDIYDINDMYMIYDIHMIYENI